MFVVVRRHVGLLWQLSSVVPRRLRGASRAARGHVVLQRLFHRQKAPLWRYCLGEARLLQVLSSLSHCLLFVLMGMLNPTHSLTDCLLLPSSRVFRYFANVDLSQDHSVTHASFEQPSIVLQWIGDDGQVDQAKHGSVQLISITWSQHSMDACMGSIIMASACVDGYAYWWAHYSVMIMMLIVSVQSLYKSSPYNLTGALNVLEFHSHLHHLCCSKFQDDPTFLSKCQFLCVTDNVSLSWLSELIRVILYNMSFCIIISGFGI